MATAFADAQVDEREDVVLTEAFRCATGGAVASPNALQQALFPRLMTQDTGLLVPTGPSAGRLEAVFVPSLTSFPTLASKQRLFIVGPDYGVLDDYHYRLSPYIKALAAADNNPRIVYFEEDGGTMSCERYLPDGSTVPDACEHPLDGNVDLVVTCFSEFRSLFFGAGGVHGMPSAMVADENEMSLRRRDLFYFDEAQGYRRDEFSSFLRLVEFLFAEDLDVLVGTTTLPEAAIEELSFLEVLYLPDANEEPDRSIRFLDRAEPWSSPELASLMGDSYRTLLVGETADDVVSIQSSASALLGGAPPKYHSGMPMAQRREVYAQLRNAEKAGRGYTAVVDGHALETSDLSADLIVTSACAPESLLRRAGRCNRRAEFGEGRIVVVGDGDNVSGRTMPSDSRRAYLDTLRECNEPGIFSGAEWVPFIG